MEMIPPCKYRSQVAVRHAREGYGRTYVCDDRNAGSTEAPAVWFSYSADRKGIRPQSHLVSYSG